MLLKETTKVFKALSDETRLRILKLLLKAKSLCVSEITHILKIPQATVSRNLGILREAGLVRDEREGQKVRYSVSPKTQRTFPGFLILGLKNWLNKDRVILKDIRRLAPFLKKKSP